MTPQPKVTINKLPTGVPGLDDILGGGIPEFSFNILAGSPGCGKTTLAHQIAFANATPEKPVAYFTVFGEAPLKMLRYQQQYTFFDSSKLGRAVRFVNLGEALLARGLNGVLEEITKRVETDIIPHVVVVDSFRSMMRNVKGDETGTDEFIQNLGLLLASWEITSFLVGEYVEPDLRDTPVFSIADGVFWLYQNVERNSIVRKLQIVKLRGQGSVPGLHTFRITEAGLQAFSRTLGLTRKRNSLGGKQRLSMGIAELDEMLGGGVPEGDSLLIAGPSGTGKSLLASQFTAAGLSAGEAAIVAVFEERPEEYAGRANNFGLNLYPSLDDGKLQVIYLRPLDLSVDETMQELLDAVKKTGAKRLVIDSLAGFEMALAPGFRVDFRESLYRMIFALTGIGVTILSTVEMDESFAELLFSTYSISFLTDDIIRLRYVEIEGQLRKIMMVVKMRGGNHSKEIREYEITSKGVVIGECLKNYERLATGLPHHGSKASPNKVEIARA
jgi:circadian clock protein KaiC